jgi:uncharacterized membrane protein (GlpM family)
MMQLVIRFVVGGVIVSLFAVLGDAIKPKSFAGLFGAAPSVALATLTLTILTEGKLFAAQECRSMIAGAIAFFFYASLCSRVMMRYQLRASVAASSVLALWFVCALSAWWFVLR